MKREQVIEAIADALHFVTHAIDCPVASGEQVPPDCTCGANDTRAKLEAVQAALEDDKPSQAVKRDHVHALIRRRNYVHEDILGAEAIGRVSNSTEAKRRERAALQWALVTIAKSDPDTIVDGIDRSWER